MTACEKSCHHFSSQNLMITLTDAASIHLQQLLLEKSAAEGSGLRILVEKGGCAGWQYTMKIDQAQVDDRLFSHMGVSLIVDPQSFTFLKGCRIDYVESLNDSGFRVDNPNAERNCGCGTSFEPKAS
jgi:iron-sulfur cluster assembly protein